MNDSVVQQTLRDLREGLSSLYEREPVIVVYGSYARGQETMDSDLDLLLLFPQQVNASREIVRLVPLLAELNLRYGMLLSVLPTSSREYREAEGPFWRNVRREGVVIHAK